MYVKFKWLAQVELLSVRIYDLWKSGFSIVLSYVSLFSRLCHKRSIEFDLRLISLVSKLYSVVHESGLRMQLKSLIQ